MSQDFIHGVDVLELNDQIRPIRTARTSVIGLVGTAGMGPVNTPTLLINSPREAVAIFGPVTDNKFTIPSALAAIFAQGPATVVVVNVVDPEDEDNQTTQVEELTLSGSVGTLTHQHIVPESAVLSGLSAPYTVVSMGTNRAFTAIASGAGGKAQLAVPNGNDYTVGQMVTVSGATSGYLGTFAVLAKAANSIDINVNYVATSTGIVTPPVNERITLPAGCVLGTIKNLAGNTITASDLTLGQKVVITYTATPAEGTDFIIDATNGLITRVTGGKLLPNATLTVDYGYVDDDNAAYATSVLGGVTGDDYTGVEVLRVAEASVFVTPRILVAPGFTHQKPSPFVRNAVVDKLATIAQSLKAVVIVDCPNDTKEGAIAHRMDFDSERLYFHYGFYSVLIPNSTGVYQDVPASPYIAGVISNVDNAPEMGFWWSPSNKQIAGIAGLSKRLSHSLSDFQTDSNYLNEHFVSCTVRGQSGGFVLWGNYMASGKFITTRRIQDMLHESIIVAHAWAVDNPINRGLLRSVVSGVKEYMSSLTRRGAILGGDAWADPEMNPPVEVNKGNLMIDFDFSDPKPAQHIRFRSHLVDRYTTEIFDETSQALSTADA